MARPSPSRRQRHLQLACFILVLSFASTAYGSGLNLSSFQLISSTGIPLNCIFAYNTRLTRCELADFTMGNQCSAGCITSLKRAERNIARSCESVVAPDNSLLKRGQEGKLTDVLCAKPVIATTTTVAVPVATQSKALPIPPTTIRSSTPISSQTQTTRTTQTTQRLQTTSSPSSEAPTFTSDSDTSDPDMSTSETLTTETSTSASKTSTSEVPLITTATSIPSERQTTAITTDTQPPQTSDEPQSTAQPEQPRRTLLPGSGGGSPFDFVAFNDSSRTIPLNSFAIGLCLLLGLVVLV